ncbi:DNA gyrase subunit A [Sporolactobacillus sp. THM7-7]|nr:DNA gyrase subunit A [Sporolactobacillus sp. THM7-7]
MAEQDESRVRPVDISHEMRNSFLDYAMSVIVSRALPDVRDGLKPVHRRILYAMNELGITSDKPHKKSARIVGEVIGKYHPHGDAAVYESMVRMAQNFSTRYELVDGHGNFGSVDGDPAAAMRYTEARMSKISMEMVRDIRKDTIDFNPNYDGSEEEPAVLPSRFPNLLVNGASGIAVGMATNIPPHQLGEVIDAVLALTKNPDVTIDELMQFIPGPDFPTGGLIMGREGIKRAYRSGRGSIIVRAKVEIEQHESGKESIIVTELPYQVNKAKLIERIASLVKEKKVDGITDLRDESDRRGMRVVIEVRRDANAHVLLNNLYKHTGLQTSFGINLLALVNGRPRVLTLKECLKHYLDHQETVIRRRTSFDLKKAEARAHILEGLRIALDHLDAVITLIRHSKTADIARSGLMENFNLTEEQAQAILDMRLQRLTGLEREKIEQEYADLIKKIAELKAILADEQKVLHIIRKELSEIKEKYNDSRRTEITVGSDLFADEDLIEREDIVITVTHQGYVKRMPVATYKSQNRGGRGIQGMGTNENDFVEHLFQTSTHHYVLFFTNKGRVYHLKGYEIPELGRTAKGIPIINLIQIEKDEFITAFFPIEDFDDEHYLVFQTKKGIMKRSLLSDYSNIRKVGLFAITVREGDELIAVRLTDGHRDLIVGTKKGMSIRFNENDVRPMGRMASGVKAITLESGDEVVGIGILDKDSDVLIVTENGFGKRTACEDYRIQTRGGKGLKTCNITERNGEMVALRTVKADEDIMIVTAKGVIIRMPVSGISKLGRNTMGVTLIRVDEGDSIASVAGIRNNEEEDGVEESDSDAGMDQPESDDRETDRDNS